MAKQAAIVIGASGGIGFALLPRLSDYLVYAVSRSPAPVDLPGHVSWLVCADEPAAREECAARIKGLLSEADAEVRRLVVCSGTLHGDDYRPERALRELDVEAMHRVYHANAAVPLLWLAALEPLLRGSPACVAAFLSARVGSISDNGLGGWYSYRGSKAALNMMLKSAAVEMARRSPAVKLLAFHPGTTDTALSRPFQARVPEGKLFTPAFVAGRLLALMDGLSADGALSFLDWEGKEIDW